MKELKLSNEKGITLLALVITIIILIILAEISIDLTVGENGIITKSKEAQEIQDIARITEKLELLKGHILIDKYGVNLDSYITELNNKKEEYEIAYIDKVDSNNAYILVEEKYKYLLKDTNDGNVEIIYKGIVGALILSEYSGTIMYPNTATFTVTKNVSGGTLSVSSSNSNIATATISGTKVTVKSGTMAGTATITVKSAATGRYSEKTAIYTVTVKPETYIVTYKLDKDTTRTENVKIGENCLSPTTFTPTKSGYTFVGWREDSTASSDVLDSKTMENEPITLYAVFSQEIIVRYDGNGVTSDVDSFMPIINRYYNNGNYKNPSIVLIENKYEKPDATFAGWAMGSVTGTQYVPGDSVTLSEDTTFYAIWLENKKYIWNNGPTENYTGGWTEFKVSTDGTKLTSSCGVSGGASPNNLTKKPSSTEEIDLTGYNYCTIVSKATSCNHYGTARCKVGFGNTSTTFFSYAQGTEYGTRTKTVTLDISTLTSGKLMFNQYVVNDSSYSGYQSNASLGITEIYLHNDENI